LILFPRRADKPKKGDIDDATADRIKSAEAGKQVTAKHLLEKPDRKLREKPRKIAAEEKNTKVYRKLRQMIVNQKYKGKREKRAAEQAEKEAEAKK
jgi:hypothetical protein